MEKEELCIPTFQEMPSFCRICVSIDDVECLLYEPTNEHEKHSLHTMLGLLFPSVFNDEQAKIDENMNWPSKICHECKRKLMDAYSLYELCITSSSRLTKMLTEEGLSVSDHASEPEKASLSVTSVVKTVKIERLREQASMHEEPSPSRSTIARELIKRDRVPVMPGNAQKNPRRKARTSLASSLEAKDETSQHAILDDALQSVDVPMRTLVAGCASTNDGESLEKEVEDDWQPSRRSAKSKTPVKRKSKLRQTKATLKNLKTNEATDSVQMVEFGDLDKTTSKIDLYHCQLCNGAPYTSPMELTEHLKTLHPDQIRSCEQCPKVFMSEQAFQHHQYCHATGRSHFCMFCDKGFQKPNLLESHIQTHTKRADFLCSLCGKEFTNHTNLRQHTKIKHSGEKPWACTLCPSRFTTKGSLKMHQYTHTKVKKFSCETCGTQFTKHSSLVKHRLIHTGERPFVCEVCKMRFVSNYMLKRHMLTHTGEKPFKCTYCERSFAQSNDMVKHIRTHVGDNLYKCDRCNASYRLLSELRNHYTEHYRSGDSGVGCSTVEEDTNIRFTTTYIMKLRLEKEKAEHKREVEFSTL